MKKRIIFACLIMITIILIPNLDKNNSKTKHLLNENEILYAINVDGKKSNKIPEKGMYNVDAKCENAIGYWDYDEWMLKVKNITGEVSCDLAFNTIEKSYLNNKTIGCQEQLKEQDKWFMKLLNKVFILMQLLYLNPNTEQHRNIIAILLHQLAERL